MIRSRIDTYSHHGERAVGLVHLKGLRVVLAGLLAGVALVVIACGGSDDGGGGDSESGLSVVASTTIIEDLVEQVGGDRVEVTSIVPSGADTHTFTVSPSDIRKAAEADLLVIVGAELGAIEKDLARSAEGDVLGLTEGMGLRPFPRGLAHGDEDEQEEGEEEEHGAFDPHFWMDVDLAIEAVETIRDELSRLDPDGAEGYRERAERYIAELRAVDNEIAELLSGLPEERRHLVTFHDAYGYFAERYGLTILGFLVEGPDEEPSATAITELVESITELGIPFIFTEPQFSARVVDQIAKDTGASIRTIPSGGLSEEYPTYVEFLRAIASGIAE